MTSSRLKPFVLSFWGLPILLFAVNASNHQEDTLYSGHPYFSRADGSYFEFSGDPNTNYCLLSDRHLNINAYFGGHHGEVNGREKSMTWMREIGFQWGHHSIVMSARQGADSAYLNGYMGLIQVDGQAITLPKVGDVATTADGKATVSWLSAKEKSGNDEIDVYSFDVPGVIFAIVELRPDQQQFRTSTDGTVHFDLYLPFLSVSNNVHGILGQTYRPDHAHKRSYKKQEYTSALSDNALPGDVAVFPLDYTLSHYKTSSITATDSAVNRFVGLSDLDLHEHESSVAMEMSSSVPSVLGSAASHKMVETSATFKWLRRFRLLRKFKLL